MPNPLAGRERGCQKSPSTRLSISVLPRRRTPSPEFRRWPKFPHQLPRSSTPYVFPKQIKCLCKHTYSHVGFGCFRFFFFPLSVFKQIHSLC